MLIDSHAHLYWDSFQNDLEAVLDRAVKAGVEAVVNIGTNLQTSQKALGQASRFSSQNLKIYSTIGIHPTDWEKYFSHQIVSIRKDIDKLGELYQEGAGQIVAIGECGLDFSSGQAKDIQRQLFRAQVDFAKKVDLPVVVHCRNSASTGSAPSAWDEVFDYLEGARGVLHCFSGSLENTKRALETCLYISYAANITYPKNDGLRRTIEIVPMDRIVLETDSPFLAPEGKRGQRNEPAHVLEVAKTIAQVKRLTLEEVTRETSANTKKLFKLVQSI